MGAGKTRRGKTPELTHPQHLWEQQYSCTRLTKLDILKNIFEYFIYLLRVWVICLHLSVCRVYAE